MKIYSIPPSVNISYETWRFYDYHKGSPYGVMTNVLDSDLQVNEFELYSHYYVHFWPNNLVKSMNLLIPPQALT